MRLVADTTAIRPGSAAVIVGNLLKGWARIAPQDELIVLVAEKPQLPLPDSAQVEDVGNPQSLLARLALQSTGVRRLAQRFHADAFLGGVTAGVLLGVGCPYAAMLYDLRHELRPAQFSSTRRIGRRTLYGWTFRRADVLVCISERTRRDLLARRPRLERKALAAPLGSEHVDGWEAGPDAGTYALAFGHFPNKNVDGVLRAWRLYCDSHPDLKLRICGLSKSGRASAEQLVAELGIGERVELLPWLSDQEFETLFAGAALILFPSDFEGFGLPAVEAMRLGVPLVVSPDEGLMEVTGGLAAVAEDDAPATLARAIEQALGLTREQLDAAVARAHTFTWNRMARQTREALIAAGAPADPAPSDTVPQAQAPQPY
jgi:glycosyltransferase involved in cell wall biosynthesis